MDVLMYLKRLEDFTPEVALKVFNHFIKTTYNHIEIQKEQLNLVLNGICDSNMKKYVVSIGDALYQIVAVDSRKQEDMVSVIVVSSNLCGTRRYAKELKPEEKTEEFAFTHWEALEYLKECITKHDSIYSQLHLHTLNFISNGIFDNNMIKYVVSSGYGLYQIAAINDKGIICWVVKYFSI